MRIPLYSKFIGGRNIKELISTIKNNSNYNYLSIIDYSKENAKNKNDILKSTDMLYNISKNSILKSYKLSYALKLSSYGTTENLLNIINKLNENSNTNDIFLDA